MIEVQQRDKQRTLEGYKGQEDRKETGNHNKDEFRDNI